LFELAPAGVMGEDLAAPEKEVAWMRRLSAEIGRPVSFALSQHDADKEQFRAILARCGEANAAGAQLAPQVGSRPTMLLIGHQTFHPFTYKPTYQALAELPLPERVAKLRDPEIKRRILSEKSAMQDPRIAVVVSMIENGMSRIFPLGDPPNYEPAPEASIAAEATRTGRDPYEVLYDRMLELDGRQLLMLAILSYSDGDLEALRDMRREHDDVPAHALGARPLARAEAADRVGGAQDDARHRVALRTARPRRGRARPEGRPQRDRLGPPRARAARARARSAGGRAPPRAARARLRGDARVGDRHDARGRAHRCAAGPRDPRAADLIERTR